MAEGKFRKIKLAVGGEAREAFVVPEIKPVMVDPLRLHHARDEVPEMVIIRCGDTQSFNCDIRLPF